MKSAADCPLRLEFLLNSYDVRLSEILDLSHMVVCLFEGVLGRSLMNVGLTFEHKEELSVGGFDRVRTDDSVRFEAVDCPFAIRLSSVV